MQSGNANLSLAADSSGTKTDTPALPPIYQRGTLQSIVSPVSEEEFRARYWERAPLIIHRGDPDYYGDLFTLQDFDRSIRGGTGYVKTAEATAKKQARHQGTGPAVNERVLTDMRDGHTLILDAMQEYNAKLGQLCRMLGQETSYRYQTNIYLTPPQGKGFMPHWDNHDVFVLQVLGSKHWKIEKTRRVLPSKDGTIEDEGRELRGDLHEITLQQGDLVYIPRGFVHAAECGPESSMHVTMGIYPNSWDDLIMAAIKAATLQDDNLRLALPIGYLKRDGAGIIKRVVNVLRNSANPEFLAQVLEQFSNEVVQKAPMEISGQIASFFQPKPLSLDDRLGGRPGLFYRIRPQEEAVTLLVGTRAITFPSFFGEALKFALETPGFAARDLPGDLEDEEKLVFLERLLQEALVVRS